MLVRKTLLVGIVLSYIVDAEPRLCAAAPAETVSADALVSAVVRANPELAFYRAEIDAARAGQRVARAWSDPELSVEGGRKRVSDAAGTLAGEGTIWSVSLAQTFEWPGRLALRKSIANRELELAEIGLQRFEAALAARARLLAYELQAAAEKAASTREVAERYQGLRELFVARDPAGITPLLETRVIEAQELALKRRASEAELRARAALTELNQLRGAPPETSVSVTVPALQFAPLPATSELLEAARQNNFEYRIRRLELEQQGMQVTLARNERFPSITVSPFFTEEKAGERERVVGVGLSVPLPLSASTRGQVDIAEARRRQAEAAVQMAWRELERAVIAAAQAYAVKTAEMAAWAPDAVAKFRDAAELADRHYRLGAVPLQTYVELQSAYLDAVEALVDTRYEALQARLRLEELAPRQGSE